MIARKTVKIFHTLASAGLIGGLGAHMALLVVFAPGSPEAYADLRAAIATINAIVLVPSLAAALVTGLLSMAVHYPFMETGWAWIKALLGIVLFEGTLIAVAGRAERAAEIAGRVADGEAVEPLLRSAIAGEWLALWIVMALCVANVALGVWRPRFARPAVDAPV